MMTGLEKKTGIVPGLLPGYIGIGIFMLGATIEATWFSGWLSRQGYPVEWISMIFTLYGISTALFSWVAGSLAAWKSPRRVMEAGLVMLMVTGCMLIPGLLVKNRLLIAVSYCLRGTAYPLTAYAFLVWVTVRTPQSVLGKATGWYWFSFNAGMNMAAPLLSTWLLSLMSGTWLLALGLVISVAGMVVCSKIPRSEKAAPVSEKTVLREMADGLSMLAANRRIRNGVIVKAINNVGSFGFLIMMPILLPQNGFTLGQWSAVWAMTYAVNAAATVFFGKLGDEIGWRTVLVRYSGTVTALSCLLIAISVFWLPGNVLMLALSFAVFAIGVAAFGPLSALLPSLVPEHKATAVSLLNLGSGLSSLLGPVLISLCFQALGGLSVLLVFATLYLGSTVLSATLKK